jgi:hypothetical protein
MIVRWFGIHLVLLTLAAQTATANSDASRLQPRIQRRPIVPGRVVVLNLGLHFTTAIRLPEAVSSVVVGDPALFKVEHSEKEPRLVFVKPVSTGTAESNLLISTVAGHSVSLLMRSEDQQPEHATLGDSIRPVYLVLDLLPEASFLIEEASPTSPLVAETVSLENAGRAAVQKEASVLRTGARMDRFLESQRISQLPSLQGNPLGVAIGDIYQDGRQTFVLFSVVNRGKQAVELLPPQVQLAGTERRRGSVEQMPVREYQLSSKRLRPNERADGVVAFDRPSFKQSHQSYFVQIAESAAVDQPTLAAIDLGRALVLSPEEER